LELEIVGQIETVPGGVQRIQNPRQT